MARRSDRWLTPGVVVALLAFGTLIILVTIGSVTFLTWQGLDPDPMLRLVAQVSAAVFSAGTFVQGLAQRRTTTNVERKAGQLEAAVVETLDQLDARTGRHHQAGQLEDLEELEPARDDHTRPHPLAAWERPPVQPGR